jgi:hypothetical protein
MVPSNGETLQSTAAPTIRIIDDGGFAMQTLRRSLDRGYADHGGLESWPRSAQVAAEAAA